MADGKIEIETGINTKGLEKDAKSLKGKISKIGNSDTLKGLSNIGAAASGVGVAFSAAKKAVEIAKAAIGDLTESYKAQAQAETQLAQAAKNNPYLLSESVAKLKSYASELQSISTYGDEELLSFMAQLASAGRTEQEIMDIMSASIDVAASGSMSLDSAVNNLNKTFSGLSGELGEANPAIKALSSEQLKNGDAVKVMAKQYAGMAQEVAKATGSSQQLQNAIGDLKEELGAPFEKAMSPIRAFFTELIGGWASAKKAKREYEEAGKANSKSETRTTSTLQTQIDGLKKEIEQREKEFADMTDPKKMQEKVSMGRGYVTMDLLKTANENYKYRTEEMKDLLKRRLRQLDQAVLQEKQAADAQKKAQEEAEAKTQLESEIEARDKLRAAYDETIRQKQAEISQRRINGEEISEEAEAQEMYNTAFAAYIKMMSDPAFKGNSGNFEHEKNARNDIAGWAETADKGKTKEAAETFVNDWEQAAKEVSEVAKSQYDALLEQLDEEYQAIIQKKNLEKEEKLRIDEEYAAAKEKIEAARDKADTDALLEKIADKTGANESYWSVYKSKIKELKTLEDEVDKNTVLSTEEKEAQKTKITEAAVQARKELIASIASDVQNYTSQAVSIMQDACNLMLETSKNEAAAEQAELETKYRKGEISEEEYNKKVAESKKKAAKEQYKIQMWQWGASILQATANIAQGVSMAIAQGGIAGLITGALVGAAGAVQIASIIASKPTPPSFSTGGIVGGSSTHGDNIAANLNSREMVMNMSQQKGLWDFINGGSNGAGGGANIVINNSAANIVSARPQITKDKIELLIDARVNESLKNGRYNTSLNMAQQGMGGEYYGI